MSTINLILKVLYKKGLLLLQMLLRTAGLAKEFPASKTSRGGHLRKKLAQRKVINCTSSNKLDRIARKKQRARMMTWWAQT